MEIDTEYLSSTQLIASSFVSRDAHALLLRLIPYFIADSEKLDLHNGRPPSCQNSAQGRSSFVAMQGDCCSASHSAAAEPGDCTSACSWIGETA